CPVTQYTTPASNVRNQFKGRSGGASDARLVCVVTTSSNCPGRYFRIPNKIDIKAVESAESSLLQLQRAHTDQLSLVPDETLPYLRSIFNIQLLDVNTWGALFSHRQVLSLATLAFVTRRAAKLISDKADPSFALAVHACLAIVVDRLA